MQFFQSIVDVKAQLDAISETYAMIRFDADGTIRHANDNFLKAMGFALEEIRGRHHSMFMQPGEEQSADYKTFWTDLRAGRARSGEFERRHKDGSIVTLEASYSPIRNNRGEVVGVLKTAKAVKSRKAAEERAARLLEMIEGLPVPIMTCDPKTFTIDYANRASVEALRKLERHLPIRADQLVGSSIDIFHRKPEHQRRMLTALTGRHQATIKVGPESLELNISQIAGRPVLVWYVVTHRIAMAESVQGTVSEMEQIGARVNAAADQLAGSAEQTVQLAGSVAAAAEEQASAIGEVAERSNETARRADKVGDAARLAQQKLLELVGSVNSISEVVSAVSSIAAQTKLLALNATIEAARAGEVGRGFAVVAAEVKALSDQTARSTEEIGSRITAIQGETEKTAHAVSEVIGGIGEVVRLIGAVAAATEEQRAVSAEVSTTVSKVSTNARETGLAAGEVASISTTVRETATTLKSRVDAFMTQS